VIPTALAPHVARTAVRALVADLVDAWDANDGDAWMACLAEGATWTDGEATPISSARERFDRRSVDEPWRLHWLTNEQLDSDGGDRVSGTWLVFAWRRGREVVDYLGADLTVGACRTANGWRIERLHLAPRFAAPWPVGWLGDTVVLAQHPGASSDPGAGPAFVGPLHRVPSADPTETAVAAESGVRRSVAALFDSLDSGADGAGLANYWTTEGTVATYEPAGMGEEAVGRAAVAALLDREAALTTAHMRIVTNLAVQVGDDGRVACRWRDLQVAVRHCDQAWWLGHHYEATLTEDSSGTWRFETVGRYSLLASLYGPGLTVPV
jgi:hypothetical protein